MIKSPATWFVRISTLGLLLLMSAKGMAAEYSNLPVMGQRDAEWIADQIYQNECQRRSACLTSWNTGEDFPSLGIGHFIWYRKDQQERFVESFPDLMAYYVARGVDLPAWLAGQPEWDAPWPDRDTFLADYDSVHLHELRDFLLKTRGIQAEFIMRRMEQSLPALRQSSRRPEDISRLFYAIANADMPHGMYALIDYVNFKGEGTAATERYNGEGWGLLQVLEFMLDHPPRVHYSQALLEQYAAAARAVLARRIENSPPERGEERWRNGWNNRTYTYVP
jgi:hypothetical protein